MTAALTAMCIMALPVSASADEANKDGWKLIWSDEFDKPEPDPEKWSRCERGKSDWSNTMSNDPGLVEWKDGVLHLRGIVNPDAEKGPAQWPFDQPFYLILSMQIGGQWVGEANAADYPAGMEIDWVRVHQRNL